MISGVMPKRKQLFHTCVSAFIFVIFTAAALVNGEMILPSHRPRVSEALRVIGFLFILLAIAIILWVMWYRRRIIREFQYDGVTLHYQTLTIRHMQSRFPHQLREIREWAGRGGVMGYQLFFRDAPKAYLEDDTPNATALIERLLGDMPKDRRNA
jgi:hypothetical protein